MEKNQYKKLYQLIFAGSFILLFVLQRCYFGIRYFPVVDDWFLYLGNSVMPSQWNDVISANGLLSQRPLACLIDSYFIIPFAGHMAIPYAVISVMLAAAVILMWKTFQERGIYAGVFVIILTALCPVNMEAVYWLSASSRICTALFFIALNGFFLARYLNERKKWCLVLHIISGIFCVGFYETAIPVYILYNAVILFYHKEDIRKNLKFLVIPIVICIGIAFYYMLHSGSGEVASRGALVQENYLEHFSFVSGQIQHVFFELFPRIIKEGLVRGIKLLSESAKGVFYAVILLIASVFFGFSYMKIVKERSPGRAEIIRTVICGILFIAAGLLVNYPLAYVRISLRVVFFAVIGIGLFIDALLGWFSKCRVGRYIAGGIVMLTALSCSVSWIGENDFYRMTSCLDEQVADALTEGEYREKILDSECDILLCGAERFYFDNMIQHLEHIPSAPSMYAAITGAVRYKLKNPKTNNILVYPKWVDSPLYATPENSSHFIVLYFKPDQSIARGTLQFNGADIQIIGEEGFPVGQLKHVNEYLYAYEPITKE